MTRLQFMLVDKNPARAAAIFAALSRHGRGVAVSEGIGTGQVAGPCVILMADEPGAIADAVERSKQARIGAKVIAYGEDPSPHRIVKAMADGAADYLHWPFDPTALVAAATAATAADSVG